MRPVMRHAAFVLAALLAAAAPSFSGAARADGKADQDAVRRAVERGELRPLAEILASLRGRLPGEVLGVEAERRKGQWVYEFRVVDGNGRLYEVYVDGKSGAIDRIKEK